MSETVNENQQPPTEMMRVSCVTCGQAWVANDGAWIARNVERCIARGHEFFRLQKLIVKP